MARLRFRPIAIYINGRKLAYVESGSATFETNDEAQIGTEGYLGHSDGTNMLNGSFTELVPVSGQDSNTVTTALNKQYITIGLRAGGKLYQSDCRIKSLAFSSENRSGKVSCSVSFEGGEPKVTGLA